jgi:hypothetical protein
MVLGVRFFRIRGIDEKVVVIVPHVTCRNEQMAEAESGKFPYFWPCPIQSDQDPVSVFERAKLFFTCGGSYFELAEVFHKSDTRVHRLRKRFFHTSYISRELLFSVFVGLVVNARVNTQGIPPRRVSRDGSHTGGLWLILWRSGLYFVSTSGAVPKNGTQQPGDGDATVLL